MSIPIHKKPSVRTGLFGSFLAVALLFVLACDKSKDPVEVVDEPPPVEESMFGRVIRASNVGETFPTDHTPLTSLSPFYYSLENNTSVNIRYKQTNLWDISFSDIYRSFIGGNNGGDKNNFGYKGPGKGGILILEKAFDDVVDIPDDSQFKTKSALIGTDDSGAFGEGIGYYTYGWGGGLFDGSWEYRHCAYAMADTVVMHKGTSKEVKLPPRTMVVKTARGNYAKIRVLSLYKDALDPKDWKRTTPHVYHTFDYVLAKAGSKKFEVKE